MGLTGDDYTWKIPKAALDVACDTYDAAICREVDGDDGRHEHAEILAVEAAAPIIVASFLRLIAEQWEREKLVSSWSYFVHELRIQADALDQNGTVSDGGSALG